VLQKYASWHDSRKSAWSDEHPQQKWGEIRAWLLKWIDGASGYDAHPLHQFCWLRDCLCMMDEMNPESLDQNVSNILFWLVQDCRNHTLQSTCSDCPDNHGVPLARVYLRVPSRETCKVLAIDPFPPYRRALSLDAWPSPDGWINIGQAIWQPPEQARDLLRKMGLTVVPQDTPFQIALDPYALYKDLECGLFVNRDERVSLQVINAQGPLGKRVVGVCSVASINSGALQQAQDLAETAAKAAHAVDDLAKHLREYGMGDKEEEMLRLAEAAAHAARTGAKELAQQLRRLGKNPTKDDFNFIIKLADQTSGETNETAKAVDELAKYMLERGMSAEEEELVRLAQSTTQTTRARAEKLAQLLKERLREALANADESNTAAPKA
jgi:hypothetical protein